MSSFPWLTVIGAIPLAGALAIAIIPATGSDDRRAQAARDLVIKQVALVASVVTLGMTAVLMPVVILASWHDADPAEPGDGTAARSAGSGPTTPRSAGPDPTTPPKVAEPV